MVNVDELNEEIKKFGVVVERMDELPKIYDDVKNQLEICREASNQLKIANEDIDRFFTSSNNLQAERHKDIIAKLDDLERGVNQKIDKTEVGLRDRVALLESNTSLALNEVKTNIDKSLNEIKTSIVISNQGINQKLDMIGEDNKKRFIIILSLVGVAIILEIVRFFV